MRRFRDGASIPLDGLARGGSDGGATSGYGNGRGGPLGGRRGRLVGGAPAPARPPPAARRAPRADRRGQAHRRLERLLRPPPRECAVDPREPEAVRLTRRTWAKLARVNEAVNEGIRQALDIDHNGVLDLWEFPDDGSGDCEDYQLLKRRLLVEEGVPRRAMRMAVVLDAKGEGHAVLMVRTTRGDLVLDNMTSAVTTAQGSGYVFLKRESGEAGRWVSLSPPAAQVAQAGAEPPPASTPR